MLFKWNYKPPTKEEKQAADELGAKLNISPILAQLLMQRGITTESAAKRFFHPQLADLINPFLMKDMDLAVDRLNDAMGRKERIRTDYKKEKNRLRACRRGRNLCGRAFNRLRYCLFGNKIYARLLFDGSNDCRAGIFRSHKACG